MDLLLSEDKPTGIVAEQVAIVEAEIAKAQAKQEKLDRNSLRMDLAIKKLNNYVGSEYGYGERPGYWDCSGLVRWFYLQQGIDLYHSATAESKAGKRVKHPKIGDIVAFHYGSVNWSFHVGIYVGDGKVLHAYNPYRDTVISDIDQVSSENGAWASYTRIADTN
jgi:cell wall-associated NlpC family hydrolase